jgi:hypothetical protein
MAIEKVKEYKMSVLTLCRDGSTAVGKSVMSTIADAISNNIRLRINLPSIASMPKARREKVLRVRKQLAHGTYNLDERLDAVLERLLTDIKI